MSNGLNDPNEQEIEVKQEEAELYGYLQQFESSNVKTQLIKGNNDCYQGIIDEKLNQRLQSIKSVQIGWDKNQVLNSLKNEQKSFKLPLTGPMSLSSQKT